MRFFGIWRKNAFFRLTGKCVFRFWSKSVILLVNRKICFYGNVRFTFFFCGKTHLAVLAGMCVFQFLRENVFFGYSGKMYMQENRIYGLKIIF